MAASDGSPLVSRYRVGEITTLIGLDIANGHPRVLSTLDWADWTTWELQNKRL
jgi:hypothetical protein